MAGHSTRAKKARKDNDAYYTDDTTAQLVVDRALTLIPPPHLITEPSVGRGAFARAVRRRLPDAHITAIDIDPQHRALFQDAVDEFHWMSWPDMWLPRPQHLIIGNPPYAEAERHVRHGLNQLAPGGWLVFLLRLAFQTTQGRAERLYSTYGLRYSWPLARRPSFTEDSQTDYFEYSALIWQRGYCGHATALPPMHRDGRL